jgi:HPt (histidine-containing phosphotransfer) domain-containing protein
MNREFAGGPGELDLSSALSRLGGSRELLCDLAGFFLADAPELLHRIEEGLTTRNAELLGRAAHSLKGLTGNIGATCATAKAAELESSAHRSDFATAMKLRDELALEIDRVIATVRGDVLRSFK